jgi:peptidoglycan/LPS O-acetylase OafA/YrhL
VGTDANRKTVAPPNHSPFLDFLRASAAFLVVIGHARHLLFASITTVDHPGLMLKVFWLVTVLKHEAVIVFFVLSGFLVGGSILKAMGKSSFSLVDYLIARFARIYIVYVPALIVTAVAFWIGRNYLTDFGGDTIRPLFDQAQPYFGGLGGTLCHLVDVQGYLCTEWKENPALWSLGYEWVLYLFAPAILGLIVMPGTRLLRFAGLALLLVIAGALSVNVTEWAFWFSAWFLGVAAWRLSRAWPIPMTLGLIALAVAVVSMPFAELQIVGQMKADIVVAVAFAFAVACRPLVAFPFFPRFFEWAASFSYSLYATNLAILYLAATVLERIGFPADKMVPGRIAFLAFGICVAAAVIFAYLMSLVTERQTPRLRGWLRSALSWRSRPLARAIEPAPSQSAR